MTDSRLYQVTAVVLRSREYGEGHRLFSLFTREQGKTLAVAKGIKRAKAKLASALQHFTLGEAQLAKGRRFDVITQMRVLDPFYGLRSDYSAFTHASYFAELFDESLEERQVLPGLFDLLVDALDRLAHGETPDLLARYVEISLIAILGYQPYLSHCAHCQTSLSTRGEDGRTLWPPWLGFSAGQGGALCPDCLPKIPGARRIAAGTVQVTQLLLQKGAEPIAGLKISDHLRHEIEQTLQEYLEYRLERRLRSTRFLRESTGDLPATTPSEETLAVAVEHG
ncbi:MAG: DNA repair protein RecO [Armatimonadota bacterium]